MDKNATKSSLIKNYKLNEKNAEEIYAEASKRLELFKSQGLTDEKEIEKRFGVILSSMLIKRVNSRAEDYEGIFFMDSGTVVLNQGKIEKTLEAFAKNPLDKEKFLADGTIKIIKGMPTVMDLEKEKWGKENKGYNKPLAVVKFRTIEGIIKTLVNGKTVMKKMSLRLNGDALKEDVPLNKIVKFRAGKSDKGENLMLYLESGTIVADDRKVENIMDLATQAYKIITVAEVEEIQAKIAKKEAGKMVVIRGIIDSINFEKDSPSINLRDDVSFENLIKGGASDIKRLMVKIPRTFDGAPFSECIVFGDLWKVGKDDKAFTGMTAKGFICPTKAVQPEALVDVEMTEPKGDEKW